MRNFPSIMNVFHSRMKRGRTMINWLMSSSVCLFADIHWPLLCIQWCIETTHTFVHLLISRYWMSCFQCWSQIRCSQSCTSEAKWLRRFREKPACVYKNVSMFTFVNIAFILELDEAGHTLNSAQVSLPIDVIFVFRALRYFLIFLQLLLVSKIEVSIN